ncbi:MAG: hypothetical protein OEX97_05480 [Acidimicrobiia bacterium]|nr:hypothetical protein [Acidimicrobiia bacterium]
MAPVLLLHWDWSEIMELAAELRGAGWDVITESEDGVRAVQMALEHPPAAVAISLRSSPLHGRDVAVVLNEQQSGSDIPVVFFDGDERARRKVRKLLPDATIVDWDDLSDTLMECAVRPE